MIKIQRKIRSWGSDSINVADGDEPEKEYALDGGRDYVGNN